MYEILLQLRQFYKKEAWIKMVEQAKKKNKLTDDEYKLLME